MFGNLDLIGGRIRGLQTAIYSDEPLAKGDAGAVGSKRVQILTAQSGNISCNWGLYDEIRISSVAAINLTFTGATDGQGCILTLKGGNDVTLPTSVRYNTLVNLYIPTPGVSSIDKVGFTYDGSDNKYDLVSVIKDIA